MAHINTKGQNAKKELLTQPFFRIHHIMLNLKCYKYNAHALL